MPFLEYPILPLTDGVAYGSTTQDGTPSLVSPVDLVDSVVAGDYRYTADGNTYTVALPTMRSIGAVKDTYDTTTGQFTQRIGVKVFDGSESWPEQASTLIKTYYAQVLGCKNDIVNSDFALCNALPQGARNQLYSTSSHCFMMGHTDNYFFALCGYATSAEWKAYVAANPVTVYYELATPVTSTITPTLVWVDLVTDREQANVTNRTAKGFYNTDDLNRVGLNVQTLAGVMNDYGYSVTVTAKTDWTAADLPREADMVTYLGNIAALETAYYTLSTTPALPADMELLTWLVANNIEQNLADMKTILENMIADFKYSGTFYSDQEVVL